VTRRASPLFEAFAELATRRPALPALRGPVGEPDCTRGALLERALDTARLLQLRGLARGDVVLVAGATGESWVVAMLAVWACDAVALPGDPQLTGPELDALETRFATRARVVAEPTGRLQVVVAGETRADPDARLPAGTAVLKLTSGSMARPRGVATTADQLLADSRQILVGMGIGPEDWNVGVVPMSHSYGLSSLLLPLIVQGSPLLLVPSPLPDALAKVLSTEEPAVFPGVPYLFDLLARPDGPTFTTRGLRLCVSAGAMLRARTAAAFREKYGLPVRSFYGTSETGGLTFDASADGDAAARFEGCVGTPLPGVAISLREEDGRVVARGASVASGYLGPCDDAATGEFRDGAFLAGDTARFDEQGRLHLTGRLGSRANVSGRKIDPHEIEKALDDLAGVREAAVSSLPDDQRGESLVAYVVAERDLTAADVLAHLRARLAAWKLPRQVVFLKALPRNARGKLDTAALVAEARRGERER